MKIVVIGGRGLTGARLVAALVAEGHETVAASRTTGVDTVTGAGLPEALAGADAVVDVTNPPSFEADAALDFFSASARILSAAEYDAGVSHHVVLSIVGVDRLTGSGYMRAKAHQEAVARSAPVPCTLLRATQFFEFVPTIAEVSTEDDRARLPPVLTQPIAVDDVVAALARTVVAAAVNGARELAGPTCWRLDNLARRILAARGDAREVVADPKASYFGTTVDDTSLTPGHDPELQALEIAPTTLDAWLDTASSSPRGGLPGRTQ